MLFIPAPLLAKAMEASKIATVLNGPRTFHEVIENTSTFRAMRTFEKSQRYLKMFESPIVKHLEVLKHFNR